MSLAFAEVSCTRGGRRLFAGVSFALHCLDLDHFKSVNDRLGHPGGDAVLQQIATRLGDCLQQHDVLARFGSDEFFIIQRDSVQPGGALLLAWFWGLPAPRPAELVGASILIGAIVLLSLAPRLSRRVVPARAETI